MSVLKLPYVEWNQGSSRLKASRGSDGVQRGGGQRGSVQGFSEQSRRRLLQTIGCVRRDVPLPMFVTLTYPDCFPSPAQAKKNLEAFRQRLKRAFPGVGAIWKLEPQERGAPHFHLLVWGVECESLFEFTVQAWFEIAGQGDINHLLFHRGRLGNRPCVEPVRTWKGVWFYAAKYLGKTFEIENWKWPGRFWGIINRECIPFGELQSVEVDQQVVTQVMRYGRRYAGLPYRSQGQTLFCDVSQWVEKLEITSTD